MNTEAEPERTHVLALLQQHGGGSAGFQILESAFRYWILGPPEALTGVVAYVEAARTWVAAGRPVAARDRWAEVARAFAAAAAEEGRGVVFFGAEPDFLAALAAAGVAHDHLPIGQVPTWDPRRYGLDGPARRSVRGQVHRAGHKGVCVRAIGPEELARRRGEIEAVLASWVASRRLAVMRFLVDLEPFTHAEYRRYYVAEQGERLVGFLAAVPVFEAGGWFVEDLIRRDDAPNGTTDLLVHTALADAAARGEAYLTLGLAPLAGVPADPGPHRRLRALLRLCYARLGSLYPFAGLHAFKARFRPDGWTPVYLVAVGGPVTLRSLHAVLTAFAGRGLLGFVLASVRPLLRRLLRRRPAR